MEVEREVESKAAEEEEEAAVAEELGGGLQIREKKKGKMGRKFEEKVALGEDSEDQHSVYLDADKGIWKCRHCTWTYLLNVETLTQLGTYTRSPIKGADVENGPSEAKESNGHKDVPAEEQIHNLRNVPVENGSNSQLSSVKKSGNGFMRMDNEIQEQAEHTPEESSTFIVEEFDVERVLREQETHDLYCPKCRSCITKRVILRKRKRTPSQSGLPPPKAPNVSVDSPPPAELQDPNDTATFGCLDTAVFRCLSCFSFFIPTECGYNILRVFWKRHDTQIPEHEPTRSRNWVSSCFGLDSSQNKDAEAEAPLLQETRDPSMGSKENSPSLPTPGTANLGENGTVNGVNNAGSLTGVSNSNGGVMGNKAQGDKQKVPATTISEGNATEKPGFVTKPPSLGGSPQINGNINYYAPPVTGFLPPGPSTGTSNSNGVIGDQAQGEKQKNPATAVSEGSATEKPSFKSPSLGGSPQINGNINCYAPTVTGFLPPGDNIGVSVGESTDGDPSIGGPEIPATDDTILDLGVEEIEEPPRDKDWDVLKSIVYGGLIESITSLGVVSSAAGTGSSTLNICALGLANLIGGLFVIAHEISELRSAHYAEAIDQRNAQAGRYGEKLGRIQHFKRHAFFAILSYVIFGLLPPVVYGFAFRVSDNKEYKLIAVAATSLLCIALLAIGKAHVRAQKDYIVSLFYYLGIAVPASGLAYVAGVMIDRLLVELGLFSQSTVSPSSFDITKFGSGASVWASL